MADYLNNTNDFLSHIEEILELTVGILTNNINSKLDEIEEWDSLAIMSFVSFLDAELNIEIEADTLLECQSPQELFELTKKYLELKK